MTDSSQIIGTPANASKLATGRLPISLPPVKAINKAAVDAFVQYHPQMTQKFIQQELAAITQAQPRIAKHLAEAQAKVAAHLRIDTIVRTQGVAEFLRSNPRIARDLATQGLTKNEVYTRIDKLVRSRGGFIPPIPITDGQRAVASYLKSQPGLEARLLKRGLSQAEISRKILNHVNITQQGLPMTSYVPKPSAATAIAKTEQGFVAKMLSKVGIKGLSASQMSLGLGGVVGMYNNLFNSAETSILGRAFSFLVDGLAIASIFNPMLILPVAALYVARGAHSILNGGTVSGLMDITFGAFPLFKAGFAVAKAAKTAATSGLSLSEKAYKLMHKAYGNTGAQQFTQFNKFFTKLWRRAKNIFSGAGRWADDLGRNVSNYRSKAANIVTQTTEQIAETTEQIAGFGTVTRRASGILVTGS